MPSPATRLFLLLPFFLMFAACNKNTLPEYYALGNLRVIALELDQPEVSPGTTVTLTPLVSDLQGGGRALTYSAVGCTDPGIAFHATPRCDGAPDQTVLVAPGTSLTGLTAPEYTAVGPSLTATVPPGILQNRSPVDQFNGVSYLILYTVTAGNAGPTVTALKRVIVSNKPTKNTNPGFVAGNGILANGQALAALPSGTVDLTPNVATGSAETYTTMYPDGSTTSQQEDLVVSWFVSEGSLDHQKAATQETNHWVPPTAEPTGRQVLVIAVLRDQRGGVAHFIATP